VALKALKKQALPLLHMLAFEIVREPCFQDPFVYVATPDAPEAIDAHCGGCSMGF
jgi:hypothetical protein